MVHMLSTLPATPFLSPHTAILSTFFMPDNSYNRHIKTFTVRLIFIRANKKRSNNRPLCVCQYTVTTSLSSGFGLTRPKNSLNSFFAHSGASSLMHHFSVLSSIYQYSSPFGTFNTSITHY